MKAKTALILMLAMLLNIQGLVFAAMSPPSLAVLTTNDTQTLVAGTPSNYNLSIYNSGDVYATNITVTISGDHPFKEDISNLKQSFSLLKPGTAKDLTFMLNVSPLAEQRLYEFEVQINYYDSGAQVYNATSKAYVYVENDNVEPIIGISEYRSGYAQIAPGVEDGIVITLKNGGTLAAKDVRVVLSGFSNTGIVLDDEIDTKIVKTLNANDTSLVSYKIKAGPNATTGSKTLTAKITYNDGYGNDYTKEYPLYFQVEGADSASANVTIDNVQYPTTIKANTAFNVTYTVSNKSGLDMAFVEAEVDFPSDFYAKTPSKTIVRNLKAGTSQTFTTTLISKASLSEQNYDGYVTVRYYVVGDTQDNIQEINSYLGFFVEAVASGSKPKLIIDHYEYGGENVLAGENYTLSLFIKNTSTSEATKNIKVTLTGEDNVFTPVDSSSSFFINSIGAGEVYQHDITLKTKIDASVKIYTMNVEMTYEDGSGNAYDENNNPYTEKEDLSIAVAQPVRLETADVVVPWEVYSGQPFYIEQEFYNMGKSTMYNMMVKLEGVESNEGSYFVGNFESGSSDYFSAQAFAYEEGTFEGKLIYTFEDALGNQATREMPFSYTVMPPMEMNYGEYPPEEMFPEEENNGGGINKLLIGGLVVILIIVGGLWIRRRRKAKRLAALEDLDE